MRQAAIGFIVNQKESFEQRLEALFREQMEESKLRGADFIRARLRWEDWGYLLPRLAVFAEEEIKARKWRGDKSGVLPEGADSKSIASEVVLKALQGKTRLVRGWTLERLERELRRMVRNEVRRLHKLKEAESVRSEWEVLPPTDEGEQRSIFDGIPDPGSDEENLKGLEAMKKAREEERIAQELRAEDEMAGKVLECFLQGIKKRRAIAARLGITVEAVTNCRKRLERKLGRRQRMKDEL